jgi:signal transduction histidine kinase/CheY-like chemotaxis protein
MARFAGLGLMLVLVLLGAFAIAATRTTDAAVTKAAKTASLNAAYERARFAVGEEESLERKYRLDPSPPIRVRYRHAAAEVLAAMRVVARTGGERDKVVARQVLAAHGPYLAAIRLMFAAVDRQDTPTVLRIDGGQVDPAFGKIESTVFAAAARNERASASALRYSESVSRTVVWLAPVVFGAGLVLLALLWMVRRREQATATAALASHNMLLSHQAEQLRQTLEAREHAESELAATQGRLHDAQKLESVGQLASGVAHDFNNLLQIILGYCGILEKNLPEESRQNLAAISEAAGRGSALTGQLLAFGRRQVLKPAVWDVNEIVLTVESMLGRVLPNEIDFKALPFETGLRARVDRGQLEQVLVNLVLNARDAMPDGGTLTIFTEPLELDRLLGDEDSELPHGPYVQISVRDTGCGMDEETAARAFEPFFTTKESGRGTGLGLASVYGIVRQSGGFVSLDSTAGVGTEIAVCLPRTLELAAAPTAAETTPPAETAEVGRVLLVEDEPGVRSMLTTYLRAQGYDVLEAADGREALEVYRNHSGQISVVVTDIVMPHLDGWGLINELRRLGETTPIIVMSGYASAAPEMTDEHLERLTKPFAPSEVERAIARLAPFARRR